MRSAHSNAARIPIGSSGGSKRALLDDAGRCVRPPSSVMYVTNWDARRAMCEPSRGHPARALLRYAQRVDRNRTAGSACRLRGMEPVYVDADLYSTKLRGSKLWKLRL